MSNEELLDKFKKKRKIERTNVSKLITKVDIALNEENVDELDDHLAVLLEKVEVLKNLDRDVESLIEAKGIEEEVTLSSEYQEKIIRCASKIKRFLKRKESTILPNTSQQATTLNDSVISQQSIKLPKIVIKPFSGDPKSWTEFWNSFESTIDKNDLLSQIEKFTYLKSYLTGTALNTISGFELSDINYDSCVKLLKDRFGRKDVIINSFMNKILKLQGVKYSSNVFALRKLYDELDISIRNLTSLKVDSKSYGPLLIPILLNLLPEDLVLEFNRERTSSEYPDVSVLLAFLKKEVECREAVSLALNDKKSNQRFETGKVGNRSFQKYVPTATAFNAQMNSICIFCSAPHDSFKCKLAPQNKFEILKNSHRCFKCFKMYHVSNNCRSNKLPCFKCKSQNHHGSVCLGSVRKLNLVKENEVKNMVVDYKNSTILNSNPDQNEPNKAEIVSSVSQCQSILSFSKNVYLQTCAAVVKSRYNSKITRILLDNGSQRSFISTNLANRLKLKPIRYENLSVYSFGTQVATERLYPVVTFELKNKNQTFRVEIEALVTSNISGAVILPPDTHIQEFMRKNMLELADSECGSKATRIEILIGSDYFWNFILDERVDITKNVSAVKTVFGWVIAGVDFKRNKSCLQNLAVMKNDIVDDLKVLWELDSIGISAESDKLSRENIEIIEQFEKGLSYENKRYETKLLWESNSDELDSNFENAKRRFENLRDKLSKNSEICQEYKSIIQEQQKGGIVENSISSACDSSYFMPHRAVIRPDKETSRVRIVFDASSKKENSKSLNDLLVPGPNLNPNLLDLILKFRKYEIAFSADIEKAFLMIGIAKEDRKYLKFLWFHDNDSFKIMNMTRLPFGVTTSPFILAATIKYHIKKYAKEYPDSFNMLNTSLYVDDLYFGADTVENASRLTSDAVNILQDASMNLRKFNSNSKGLKDVWYENKILLNNSHAPAKILGLEWNSDEDLIKLDTKTLKDSLVDQDCCTKRTLLQTAARIYDPVGFISPFIIRIKLILQDTWIKGLEWDDQLPPDLEAEYRKFTTESNELLNISIDRKYFQNCSKMIKDVVIHIFCDASLKAYGAVAYFRYVDNEQKIKTSFILSKSRVAPLKKLTLPRLELMGAIIGARLSKYLLELFEDICQKVVLWSDSQIVLNWIKSPSKDWKPFVCNRIQEIQQLTNTKDWHYCLGKDNPADLLTRGSEVNTLKRNSLWWTGPYWLTQPQELWPRKIEPDISNEIVTCERRSKFLNTLTVSTDSENTQALLDLNKFSNLTKLYRVTAWILRFVRHSKPNSSRTTGPLTASEIANAEVYWVRVTQNKHYMKELADLSSSKKIAKSSVIYSLNPEVDDVGLLRLKGRIQFSSCSYTEKHPWLLPSKDKFTELVIMKSHEKVLHCGVDATLVHLREKYWIVKGRQRVKAILRNCIICKRFNSRPGVQEVAPLPPDRILESPPFYVSGLDYAGPFFTRENNDKHYLLLFTCAVTRALHLEVVPSMSTESFLLAFRRFISRRGLCSKIYSDNAKSFKKANCELQKIWKSISHSSVKELFASYNIEWHYIVERGAWWGGFWERMVRTIKTSLRKIVGRSTLSLNELETVFIEIEAMINSRPITYVYDEPTEPSPLTPAHFLIGKRLLSLPVSRTTSEDLLVSSRNSLVKKFKHQQHVLNHFWRRWRKNYLLDLRSGTICPQNKQIIEFKKDDVVLIHDDRYPRNIWQLGKILQVFPGRDGKIRSCFIKTPKGVIKRPIQLLYNMEMNN